MITLIITISMTRERNIAHVRQSVGRSVRSLIVVRSGNPIWRTSKAVVERSDLLEKQAGGMSVLQEMQHQLRVSLRRELFSTHPGELSRRSSEKYIFPRTRLSSFHSDYLRRAAPWTEPSKGRERNTFSRFPSKFLSCT